MPTYKITAPDGKTLKINAPEGATQEQVLAYAQQQYKPQAKPAAPAVPEVGGSNPAEDSSFLENLAAGYGGSFVDAARGFKQAVTERVAEPLNALGNVYGALGLGQQREAVTGAVNRSLARQQQEIDEAARLDTPLKQSGGGMTGNVLGAVTQLVGPGVVLRNTAARSAFLPQTVKGNAVQGAVYGAVQPVETGGSRANNVVLNSAAAGAGAAVPRLLGATYRGAKGVVEPFTKTGQERVVARTLQRSAADPARIAQAAPSPIPGVQRTLAEETLDPGIANLQRQFPVQLAEQQATNNAARLNYLRSQFGGATPEGAESIREATRTAQTAGLREAQKVTGVETGRVVSWIDRVGNSPRFRGDPDVGGSLSRIRGMIVDPINDVGRLSAARGVVSDSLNTPRRMSSADHSAITEARRLVISGQRAGRSADEVAADIAKLKPTSQAAKGTISDVRQALRTAERGKDDVASLYNARKYITGTMMKSASGAQMEALRGVVSKLDEQIAAVAPTYKQYLGGYASGMREADRVGVGADLIRRTTSQGVDERNLQPASFLRATDDMDSVVRASTGFGRATAARTLTPQQMGAVGNVRGDLARMVAGRDAGRAAGSPTAQNLATQNALTQIAGSSKLARLIGDSQIASRAITPIEKTYGLFGVPERLQAVLVDALSDPARARALLSTLNQADRRVVENALVRVGGTAGTMAPALAE